MSEAVVRRAVDAFMARDLDGILAEADEEIVLRSLLTEAERPLYHGHEGVRDWFENVFGVFPDWTPRPRPASRVEAAKIRFFGFFRTEEDALEAVARQRR
jgi:hypothetical protein